MQSFQDNCSMIHLIIKLRCLKDKNDKKSLRKKYNLANN